MLRWENGYVLLNKIVSYINSDQQSILLVTSFIILVGVFYFIYRNSPNVCSSLFLFLSFYYYLASFNTIRQFIAIAFILFAYHYIIKRKFFKFLFFVLLASSFHSISIFMIVVYFLYGIRLTAKNTMLISGTFLLILVGFNYLLEFFFVLFPGYRYYFGTDYLEGSGWLTTLISLSILSFGLFIKYTNKTNKEFDFLLWIMILSVMVSMLSMQITLFNRFGYYMSIYNILFIPYSLSMVKEHKVRILYADIIYIIVIFYFILRLINNWLRVVPYEFY